MTSCDLLAAYRRGPAARRAWANRRWEAAHALLCRWRAAGVVPDLAAKALWRRVRDELRCLDWTLVTTRIVPSGATPDAFYDKEITLPALRRGYLQWRELHFASERSVLKTDLAPDAVGAGSPASAK